jgi:UDP-N-acetyl-D-glucosamine dehydrogenase
MNPPRKIAVIGLGYVGLPLAALFLTRGHTVFGIDFDKRKLEALQHRRSYLTDLTDSEVAQMFAAGTFHVGDSYQPAADADAVVLCVPTPLDAQAQPDLRFVQSATATLVHHLQPGTLVVLESSTYPGTTEEVLQPLLESTGLRVGETLFLAYSPERIDPGQTAFALHQIPKVVGGVTPACTEAARRLYASAFDQVVVVSSAKVAEMTKILENTQRLVNISLINELAMLCHKMDINLWEVIEAASTKPFGFTRYQPGPGIGGHCIPVDPLYLQWKAQAFQFPLRSVKIAHEINEEMPQFVVDKLQSVLPPAVPLPQAQIFVLGVTYKKDINDLRESAALRVVEQLVRSGAHVRFFDPFVEELTVDGQKLTRTELTDANLQQPDVTLILTDHSSFDYEQIVKQSRRVLDTRNATKLYQTPEHPHITLL